MVKFWLINILIYFVVSLSRLFEPDPFLIQSMDDLDACEKNLLDTLARVTEKKVELIISV